MFTGSYFKILAFCILSALFALAWNPALVAGDSVPATVPSEVPRGRALAKIMNTNSRYDDADGNTKTLRQYWDNVYGSTGDWFDQHKFNILVLFGGIILTLIISTLVSKVFAHVIIRRLAARNNPVVNDLICEAVTRPLHAMVFSIGLFLSVLPLLESLPSAAFEIIFRIFLAAVAGSIAWAVFRLTTVLNHFLLELASRTDNNLDNLLVDLIRKAVRLTIAVVSVLFIGQSILGINITTLLAGAGVCGLALAFAAKDTVANFFGSVMIIVDKPFSVGERIKIENVDGVVECVGFRSTRIRTLDGHLFTIPNSKVADAAIENISKRPYIKYAYSLGLTYDTSPEKVDRAVQILYEILDNHESFSKDMPPAVCFDAFKDWSLNISVVVWYKTTDGDIARKWQHEQNLMILKRFNEAGIEFAFPTSTSYLAGDRRHPVQIDKRD